MADVPQIPQQNVVTVAVPPVEGTYFYVAVKGSLHATDSSVFGLDRDESTALAKRFANTSIGIVNGISIKGSPMAVINSLSQLGYKVVCSTGETEVIWTLAREI